MIDVAMKFLRDFLNQEILAPENPVVLGNITKEGDMTDNHIHLTLVQVEEEKVLKEVNHRRRLNPGDNFFTTLNPEIRLNLYILVTYQYSGKNYEEALKQLSNVITTLQGKNVFNKPDFMNPLYEPLEQIVVDLFTQTMDQNSNMWQAMGEKLAPSLLYKMRVIGIQAFRQLNITEEIKAVGIDVVHKTSEP